MTLVVLLAVLFDRNAISMRLVAWAAAVVLLIAPESLMSASFQLSFAAVVALVAFYEALRPRLSSWRHGTHMSRRAALYLVTILLTTVIAGLATAPFAMMSFNRLATFGVVANILAVPLTGFWIMPWAIVAFLLMPFGLEGVALVPMGWGIDAVIAIATTVAGWPGSVRLVPAPPDMMVVLVAAGGLWLCLWAPALALRRCSRSARRYRLNRPCTTSRRPGRWRQRAHGGQDGRRPVRDVIDT